MRSSALLTTQPIQRVTEVVPGEIALEVPFGPFSEK